MNIRWNKGKGFNSLIVVVIIFISTLKVGQIVFHEFSAKDGGNSFAYVSVLNYGLPLIKTETYNPDDYQDQLEAMKSRILSTFGLSKFTTANIIGNEINFFKQFGYDNDGHSNELALKPFDLNEKSITKINVDSIDNTSLKNNSGDGKPQVLIYHTHYTESFGEGGSFNNDEKYNIAGVGNELEKTLEETYGIKVIHDKTVHNVSDIGAYERSRETVNKYLSKYGDFDIVLDLHRDGLNDVSQKPATTMNINGINMAKISFVTAQNSPRYAKNQALLDRMNSKANELFPGLARKPIVYSSGKGQGFNQGLSDNCLLIEVGSQFNTVDEANQTARIIARLIAEELSSRKK